MAYHLLANVALVGEAIALAMKTSTPQTSLTKTKIALPRNLVVWE